jgi:hypothetical protein
LQKSFYEKRLIELQDRTRKGFMSDHCSGKGIGSAGLDLGSNASLQSRKIEHVGDPVEEAKDFGWFKICKGKAVRQNLDPLLESKRALGVEKPVSMLLRPPAGDSVTQACKRPWRKIGDDIQCL